MMNSAQNIDTDGMSPQPEGGFLQSRFWADFQRAVGHQVESVQCADFAQYGIVHQLPVVGKYGYIPRLRADVDSACIHDIVRTMSQYTCGWVRMDISSRSQLQQLQSLNYRIIRAPHNVQPVNNLIVDLQDVDDILAQMKSKTRYNVRLAQKKGVQVQVLHRDDAEFAHALQTFCDMVEQTAKRKGVRFHNSEYYRKMFAIIPAQNIALYIAQYKEEVLAANIVIMYRDTVTYLHGATGNAHRNVMAPFLLQFVAMQNAHQKKYQYYDFGGVFPDSSDVGKKGITRFKRGFAPRVQVTQTIGSYDIVISLFRYNLYRMIQKLKALV